MKNAIYKIINTVNQKFYVGSTHDTDQRFPVHLKRLRSGRHHCAHLQASWNKHGEAAFVFEVIETYDSPDQLEAAEDRWLDEHYGQPYFFNTGRSSKAPWRGVTGPAHPFYGRVLPDSTKQAVSDGLKAHYAGDPTRHPRCGTVHTEETLGKIRSNRTAPSGENHYRYGQTLSAEVRKKIGDAQRGVPKRPRVLTPEGLAKIRASAAAGNYAGFKGKVHTETSRAKMSVPVEFVWPDGRLQSFTGYSAMRDVLGIHLPTLQRAARSGKPISKGPYAGCQVRFSTENTGRPPRAIYTLSDTPSHGLAPRSPVV